MQKMPPVTVLISVSSCPLLRLAMLFVNTSSEYIGIVLYVVTVSYSRCSSPVTSSKYLFVITRFVVRTPFAMYIDTVPCVFSTCFMGDFLAETGAHMTL